MTRPLQLRRMFGLALLVLAAFVGLGYRLVDLQVLRHDEFGKLAQDNTQREFWQAPRRGDILDARGNLLATCDPVKTVCADPSLIGNFQRLVAQAIAPLLQLNENDLVQKLTPHPEPGANGATVTNNLHYVRIARQVNEETWNRIAAAMSNLPARVNLNQLSKQDRAFLTKRCVRSLFAEPDQRRVYPNGPLAAQVIGFSTVEETRSNGHVVKQIVGHDGVEMAMQKQLSGVAGWKVTETDKFRQEQVNWRDEDVQARDGLNVVLTIDAAIQHILETTLADAMQNHTPRSITGIVLRPRTGEILAMASFPNYDPNNLSTVTTNARNRVVTDVVEPGSTFKIVVVSGALNEGVVKVGDEFDCEHGHFVFAGRTLHDHEPYGVLNTEGIITKSSNIGAAKIGIRLGEQQLYDYAWDFGFGQRTGILPGEVSGILHPVKDWTKVSVAQIPMGQGVAVTRLQMAMAMAALANDGWLMQPTLVSRLEDRDGHVVQQYKPQRIRQVVSETTDKLMVKILKTVVTPDGTAPGAAMQDYVAAGKTGTAQVAEKGGYASDKFISSFIGFFPADDPQICISVVMDQPKEGYYGGQVCGPVFREIAERCASYLSIPPDKNSQKPLSPASLVAASAKAR